MSERTITSTRSSAISSPIGQIKDAVERTTHPFASVKPFGYLGFRIANVWRFDLEEVKAALRQGPEGDSEKGIDGP